MPRQIEENDLAAKLLGRAGSADLPSQWSGNHFRFYPHSSTKKSSSNRFTSTVRATGTPTPCSIMRSARRSPSIGMARWGQVADKIGGGGAEAGGGDKDTLGCAVDNQAVAEGLNF